MKRFKLCFALLAGLIAGLIFSAKPALGASGIFSAKPILGVSGICGRTEAVKKVILEQTRKTV